MDTMSIHFATVHDGPALCGAVDGITTTTAIHAVDCPECRRILEENEGKAA